MTTRLPVAADTHSPAFEPARDQRAQSKRRLEDIIQIQQRIASAGFDAGAVLRVVSDDIARLIGANALGVGLLEGDHLVYRGPLASSEGTRVALRGSVSGECVATGRAIHCRDTESAATVAREQVRAVGVRSLLVVPLMNDGGVIGTIAATSPEPNVFTEEDLQTLELLAGTIGVALRHAIAHAEHERLNAERIATLDRLRTILNTEPHCVKVLDESARIVDMNPAGLAMLEVDSIQAVRGHAMTEFVLPEYVDALERLHATVLAGDAATMEFIVRGARGTLRRVHSRLVPLREADGRIVATLSITRDVTEQHAAEQALRASEAKFSGIVSIAADAIIAFDEEFRIVLFNRGAEETFGYAADEVIGKPHELLLPAWAHATHASFVRGFEASRSGPRRMLPRRPVVARRKNGEEFPAEASVARVEVEGRALFAAVVRDISDRIRAEEALRQSEAQLRQSQKMEAVGQLAGGVAHDFNNMLTVIISHADWLRESTDAADARRESIQEITEAASRAAGLTRQLLAFSRKQLLRPQSLDLDAVVHGMVPMLRRLISEDIHVEIRSETAAARVLADRGQLEQVILNLAVNARDAMPGGGTLTLETARANLTEADTRAIPGTRAGPYVTLTVRDTGIGIPADIRERIFEPFFTTKDPGAGTGLGLSTVYGIVRQSDGAIVLNSVVDQGTTFTVYLPYVAAAESETPPAATETAAADGTSKTILLVEDEAAVRSVARQLLEARGYRVLAASNGREGIEMANAYGDTIDLVLTDVVMPELDGRRMVERLHVVRPDLRVAFMSGYTSDEVLRRGLVASGQLLLQKPFTARELYATVDEALRSV